jgi:hypothetical protein
MTPERCFENIFIITCGFLMEHVQDIGITMTSKGFLTQVNVKVWVVWVELKELACGSHWSDWQTERNTTKFNRDLGGEDVYNPDVDRSIDVEKSYCVV